MRSEWVQRRIGSLGTIVTGKTPSTRIFANFGDKFPFITIPDLDGRVFIDSSERYLSDEGAKAIRGSMLPPNAVMMSCIATVGKCGITTHTCFTNQQINSVICNKDVDPRFVYYCFKILFSRLESYGGGGSVYTNISKSRFSDIEISIPPLHIQQKIASILGALDDKIELNRRMNKTLEEIAQTLFHFRLLDNPDQLVPFTDFIEVNPPRQLKKGVLAPYLEMSNLPTKGHRAINWYNRPYSSGVRFINGDTIFARITPCLENGKTAFVDFLENSQIGWGSTEYIIFRPKKPIPVEIGYFFARSEIVRKHAIQNMTGTSGRQRTPASCFDNLRIPPINIDRISQLGDFFRKTMVLIKSNDEQSQTLVKIRDLLIPRLLSGDL
jgi:type I restriction enzyme, S subunit